MLRRSLAAGKGYIMQFSVKHRSPGRIRIRLASGKISLEESRKLRLSLLALPQVRDVRIFMNTGGTGIYYDGEEASLLEALKGLDTACPAANAYPDTEPESPFLDAEEIRKRGLAPHVKRKMRMQFLTEAAFDAVMPAPVQLAWHAVQLYRLEKL
jgi:hypothetical protein